jgi:hypothetical protein
MAFDKVIDSAQLEADLTTIANAIREKAGVSDNFNFPTGFAEAITAIEAGGGGGLATGAITFDSDVTYTGDEDISTNFPRPVLTIEHSLGYRPTFFVFFSADKKTKYQLESLIVHRFAETFAYCYRTTFNSYGVTASNMGSSMYSSTSDLSEYFTDTSVCVTVTSTSATLPAGYTYYWIAC